MTSYIELAVEIVGGEGRGQKVRAARGIGISPAYLDKMLRNNHVPAEQCRKFEVATGGKVTVHMLRPDIFGPPENSVRQ